MGYLIDQGYIKKETFEIRTSTVLNMDAANPHLLKVISGSYFIPIAANVTLDTSSYIVGYTGFNHLHLSINDTIFSVPAIIGTIASNAIFTNSIERNFNYQFIMNFQTSPNRFGSNISANNNLYIWWDILPISGDSSMFIDIYYVNQNLR